MEYRSDASPIPLKFERSSLGFRLKRTQYRYLSKIYTHTPIPMQTNTCIHVYKHTSICTCGYNLNVRVGLLRCTYQKWCQYRSWAKFTLGQWHWHQRSHVCYQYHSRTPRHYTATHVVSITIHVAQHMYSRTLWPYLVTHVMSTTTETHGCI